MIKRGFQVGGGAINSQSNVLKIFFMWSKSFLKVLDRFGWSADPCAICFYRQMCKLPKVAQLLRRRHSWAVPLLFTARRSRSFRLCAYIDFISYSVLCIYIRAWNRQRLHYRSPEGLNLISWFWSKFPYERIHNKELLLCKCPFLFPLKARLIICKLG